MYNGFFSFREKPFSLLPDPRFVVLSSDQREALSTMIYAVERREGWALLVGNPGSGKTTLVAALKQELTPDVVSAVIEYPRLDVMDFFHTLGRKLGLRGNFQSKGQFVAFMEQLIVKLHQRGKTLLVVIDEAHNLSLDVLEELRLLSNLDALLPRVLHIYLVGQPELVNLLRDPRCGGLLQRLRWRIALHALTLEETAAYVRHRILVADGNANIFDQHALDAVHQTSRGVPRLINMVCDEALLMAYMAGSKTVTRGHVMTAAEDLDQAVAEQSPEDAIQAGVLSLPFPGQPQSNQAAESARRSQPEATAAARKPEPAQEPARAPAPLQTPPSPQGGSPAPFQSMNARSDPAQTAMESGAPASRPAAARSSQPLDSGPSFEDASHYTPHYAPSPSPGPGGGFRPPAGSRPAPKSPRGPFTKVGATTPKMTKSATGGFKKRVLVLLVLLLIVSGGYFLLRAGGISSLKSYFEDSRPVAAPATKKAPSPMPGKAGSESRLSPASNKYVPAGKLYDAPTGTQAAGGKLAQQNIENR